jgi:hypothetical protein
MVPGQEGELAGGLCPTAALEVSTRPNQSRGVKEEAAAGGSVIGEPLHQRLREPDLVFFARDDVCRETLTRVPDTHLAAPAVGALLFEDVGGSFPRLISWASGVQQMTSLSG